MKRDQTPKGGTRVVGTRKAIITAVLLTVVGFNLRAVILGVPPVLPLIRQDLALSYTAIGLLTSLPVLVMGGFAWPAGLLAGRVGARTMVLVGLALLAAGALLRAVAPGAAPLFFFTFALSLGIALAQTAAPVLTRQWFPTRIGLVSALFSDGLIVGESVAAGVTVPIMRRFFGADAWQATFVVWSVPVLLAAALWALLAPAAPATRARPAVAGGASSEPALTPSPTDTPARPRVSALHLGILLGCGSLVYFGMNGWIANYNRALRLDDITPVALSTLNAAQLPVSFAVTIFAQRLAGRRWPFIAAGTVCVLSMTGWVLTPHALEPLWAGLLGGASACVFVLGLALPPLLAGPGEVARLTGLTLTISYSVAFVGPLVGGSLWDTFGQPILAFLPVATAGCLLIILGVLLPARAAFGLLGDLEHAIERGDVGDRSEHGAAATRAGG
ncbi:MAG TPA: MFS transporter [Ktedonobacterales bacterium]|nr:MFS transporter [Ktedonobacterales bacterium]